MILTIYFVFFAKSCTIHTDESNFDLSNLKGLTFNFTSEFGYFEGAVCPLITQDQCLLKNYFDDVSCFAHAQDRFDASWDGNVLSIFFQNGELCPKTQRPMAVT